MCAQDALLRRTAASSVAASVPQATDEHGDELREAAEDGDVAQIEALVCRRAQVDAADEFGALL